MNRKMSSIAARTTARLVIAVLIFMGIAVGIAVAATSFTDGGSNLVRPMSAAEPGTPANVTVLFKNREFPLKMRMTMQPCSISACVDV